jgi:hypothetical protein
MTVKAVTIFRRTVRLSKAELRKLTPEDRNFRIADQPPGTRTRRRTHSNLCGGSSLFAQQNHGIDRERALRRNPCSQ